MVTMVLRRKRSSNTSAVRAQLRDYLQGHQGRRRSKRVCSEESRRWSVIDESPETWSGNPIRRGALLILIASLAQCPVGCIVGTGGVGMFYRQQSDNACVLTDAQLETICGSIGSNVGGNGPPMHKQTDLPECLLSKGIIVHVGMGRG